MHERHPIQQQLESAPKAGERTTDDRRRTVSPNDKPVPSSPEPEHEAVRAGEEKLERVKAY